MALSQPTWADYLKLKSVSFPIDSCISDDAIFQMPSHVGALQLQQCYDVRSIDATKPFPDMKQLRMLYKIIQRVLEGRQMAQAPRPRKDHGYIPDQERWPEWSNLKLIIWWCHPMGENANTTTIKIDPDLLQKAADRLAEEGIMLKWVMARSFGATPLATPYKRCDWRVV